MPFNVFFLLLLKKSPKLVVPFFGDSVLCKIQKERTSLLHCGRSLISPKLSTWHAVHCYNSD